jgi:hypothetical protein
VVQNQRCKISVCSDFPFAIKTLSGSCDCITQALPEDIQTIFYTRATVSSQSLLHMERVLAVGQLIDMAKFIGVAMSMSGNKAMLLL